jgi:hypothetical protein
LIELLPRLTEALIRVVVRENDELGSGITPCFKVQSYLLPCSSYQMCHSRQHSLGCSPRHLFPHGSSTLEYPGKAMTAFTTTSAPTKFPTLHVCATRF